MPWWGTYPRITLSLSSYLRMKASLPTNAARCVEWQQFFEGTLGGVRFAVFGCGHSKFKMRWSQVGVPAE